MRNSQTAALSQNQSRPLTPPHPDPVHLHRLRKRRFVHPLLTAPVAADGEVEDQGEGGVEGPAGALAGAVLGEAAPGLVGDGDDDRLGGHRAW